MILEEKIEKIFDDLGVTLNKEHEKHIFMEMIADFTLRGCECNQEGKTIRKECREYLGLDTYEMPTIFEEVEM